MTPHVDITWRAHVDLQQTTRQKTAPSSTQADINSRQRVTRRFSEPRRRTDRFLHVRENVYPYKNTDFNTVLVEGVMSSPEKISGMPKQQNTLTRKK